MSWWKPAHAGSRSLAVVFVNLGHHRLKHFVGLLEEIQNGCGLVLSFSSMKSFSCLRRNRKRPFRFSESST
jgi:hypothetical protein